MSEKPIVVGASWCGFTQKQYEILDSIDSSGITVCNIDKPQTVSDTFHVPLCTTDQAKNVTAYPSWKQNNSVQPGLKTADQILGGK